MNNDLIINVVVDDVLQFTIQNPAARPFTGEFIDTPPAVRNRSGHKEVYVGKVVNKYPDVGNKDAPTIVECQCSFA